MRSMKCSAKLARPANLRRIPASLLTLIFFCALASSQETTLRSQSNIVLIPALVKDSQGSIVYGLQAQDFIVEDDGVAQTIRLDETPEAQPVSLIVAILDPLFALGTAQVAVVEFDKEVKLAQDFTSNENLVDEDLKNLQPGNDGASILDAVRDSVDLLKKQPEDRLRILLLISEERDHGSTVKLEDAVAAVGQSNALMYALVFSPALSNILDTERGTNKNEMNASPDLFGPILMTVQAMRKNVPKTIAAMTGGVYEPSATKKKFDIRMNDFTNHLHSRYLLSFAPKNPHPGLHQIRVRLKSAKKDTVLARTSYWAQPPTQ